MDCFTTDAIVFVETKCIIVWFQEETVVVVVVVEDLWTRLETKKPGEGSILSCEWVQAFSPERGVVVQRK
jgi:uncharacterized protein (UPF0179 family)